MVVLRMKGILERLKTRVLMGLRRVQERRWGMVRVPVWVLD